MERGSHAPRCNATTGFHALPGALCWPPSLQSKLGVKLLQEREVSPHPEIRPSKIPPKFLQQQLQIAPCTQPLTGRMQKRKATDPRVPQKQSAETGQSAPELPQQVNAPAPPATFRAGWVALFCTCATFLLLAQTLHIPFYLSDDSPSMKHALELRAKLASGNIAAAF